MTRSFDDSVIAEFRRRDGVELFQRFYLQILSSIYYQSDLALYVACSNVFCSLGVYLARMCFDIV